MGICQREPLLNDVFLNTISDKRFKTNRISIFLITELQEKTAATYALLPNLLRKGTTNHPDFTEFNQYLNELYGAYVDCGVQKRGDTQIVTLSIVSIDDRFTLNEEDLTAKLVGTLCDMLLHPILQDGCFKSAEVALEKETLVDTIRAEINDKRIYALQQANRLMCKGEPCGLSKLGTVEQVQALTPEEVTAAYYHLLETARIELFFTGCGDASVARTIFQEKLQHLTRAAKNFVVATTHVPQNKVIDEVERMDVAQSKMVLGFAVGELKTPEQTAAMQMMVSILGATPLSKLFVNVREKLSLCYYCAARLDAIKGILKIDSGVENQNIEKAKAEIFNQLDEMKKGNFTEDEIKNALMSLENSFRTTNDSNGALEGYYLGQVLRQPVLSPEQKAQLLAKVTHTDIVNAANAVQFELCYVLTGKEN